MTELAGNCPSESVQSVDLSWNDSWTGADQMRFYKFEGGRLGPATTKSLDPVEGKLSVRTKE